MELTKSQKEILEHTVNRAANGNYCGDSDDMQALVVMGLMRSVGKTSFCPDEYFKITPKGREVLNSF